MIDQIEKIEPCLFKNVTTFNARSCKWPFGKSDVKADLSSPFDRLILSESRSIRLFSKCSDMINDLTPTLCKIFCERHIDLRQISDRDG